MEIYDSRYFIINKTLMTKMGLWPYQHPLKKFILRTFLVVFIFVSSMPQLYGLKKNFGVHMDKIIEHLALLLYIYGIKLKLVTSILSEEKVLLSRCSAEPVQDDPDKYKCLAVLVILLIQLLICQWAPDVLLSQMITSAMSFFTVLSSFRQR